MSRKRLFLISSFIVIFIFIINYLANFFYWYSSVWYFDMIMHFLGGFWVGSILVWLFFPKNNHLGIVLKLLFGVLVVGLGWEIFEFFVNANIAQNSFDILDTFSDLFFDMFGGLLVVFYLLKKVTHSGFYSRFIENKV